MAARDISKIGRITLVIDDSEVWNQIADLWRVLSKSNLGRRSLGDDETRLQETSEYQEQGGSTKTHVELLGQKGAIEHYDPSAASPYRSIEEISSDPWEVFDFAAAEPKKLQEMIALWEEYAVGNNAILPTGDMGNRS